MFPKSDTLQAIIVVVVCVVIMGIYVWWQVERDNIVGANNCVDVSYHKGSSFTRCQCPDGSVIEYSGLIPTTPCK